MVSPIFRQADIPYVTFTHHAHHWHPMNVGRQAAEAASRLLLVPSVPSSPGPASRPQIQVYQDFPGLQISIDLSIYGHRFFDGKYGCHPISSHEYNGDIRDVLLGSKLEVPEIGPEKGWSFFWI